VVFNPVDNQFLGADVGFAAAHAEPDEIIICSFYTFGADIHHYSRLNFYMSRRMSLLTDVALTNIIFHLLPPSSGYRFLIYLIVILLKNFIKLSG
jgi:hypothetical protein